MRRALSVLMCLALTAGCGDEQASTQPSGAAATIRPSTSGSTAHPSASAGAPATTASAAAGPPEIWFAPMPDAPPGLPVIDGADDFGDVLRPDAAWPVAAARTDVFEVLHNWVRGYATPTEISAVVETAKKHGHVIGLGVGALSPEGCGDGIEGFDATLESLEIIQAAGGHVGRIAFDEPFDFGHLYDGPKACLWSVEKVATRVAAFTRQLRASEPGVLVGDIEGLTAGRGVADLLAWVDTYRAVAGEAFDFMQLDVDWRQPGVVDDAVTAVRELRSRGMRTGVIYNGGLASDDAAWTSAARANILAIEDRLGGPPDQAIVQSWMHWPTRVLPETEPTTLSGLLRMYLVGEKTTLSLDPVLPSATGLRVSGRLVTRGGAPVVGARIGAVGVSLDPADREAEVSGTVPTQATQALVGVRVNNEYPDPRAATLSVYGVSYQEGDGPNLVPDPEFATGRRSWNWWGDAEVGFAPSGNGRGNTLVVTATANQQLVLNGVPFPVTPGARFRLTSRARVPGGGGAAPFVAVFFLNSGIEVLIPLRPPDVNMGGAVTGATGEFAIPVAPPPGSWHVVATYGGAVDIWPTDAAMTLAVQ